MRSPSTIIKTIGRCTRYGMVRFDRETWTKGLPACVGDWGNDRSLLSLNHPVTMQRQLSITFLTKYIAPMPNQDPLRLSQAHLNLLTICPPKFQQVYVDCLGSLPDPERQDSIQ